MLANEILLEMREEGSFDKMTIFSRRRRGGRSTVSRRCEGVKFHATHTWDRLTASATRISPRQRAEMRKGGLGRATSPLKVPGKLPEA